MCMLVYMAVVHDMAVLALVLVGQFRRKEEVFVPVLVLLDNAGMWFLDQERLFQSSVAVWLMSMSFLNWCWLLRALCDLN